MNLKEDKIEEVYALIGRTHGVCQLFEYKLAEVLFEWRIHIGPQEPLAPEKVVEEIREIQKSTFKKIVLGPNIKKLQEEGCLTEDIIELLNKFKNQRNDFIHDFHNNYGIELMLIKGNFEEGIFNEEHVKEAYCKLKTDLKRIITNMENATILCKKIANIISGL